MIKFILTVQLCSIVHMDCMKEFQSNIVFNSYYECMVSGHQRSINTFKQYGRTIC